MKAKFTILISVLFLVITSCDNDDTNSSEAQTIDGSWSLTHVQGGFAGVDDTYESGVIVWTFNDNDQSLLVVNNNPEDAIYDGLESGSYTYTISELNDEDSYLVVNSTLNLGKITLDNNTLILDDNPGADGFLLTLVR